MVTFAVENLLQVYFPEESRLRKTQHEDEMLELARYMESDSEKLKVLLTVSTELHYEKAMV